MFPAAAFFRRLCAGSLLVSSVQASTLTTLLQDTKGRPLPDAVVTLQPRSGSAPAPTGKATIEQLNKEFIPRVTVIATGSRVWFPNLDRVRHHVYSFSAAKKFDIKLYAGDPPAPVLFDKPGLVVLGCNIHDWMVAYVYITDAPLFGKTDTKGRLVLANVPAGDYVAHVWHPDLVGAELVKTLRVGSEATELKLSLDTRAGKS
jgi:plastocyanin